MGPAGLGGALSSEQVYSVKFDKTEYGLAIDQCILRCLAYCAACLYHQEG